tara:strand:- start:563 stop:685 length:123 start_codon:yes stop_codon:yes gene_type:complete
MLLRHWSGPHRHPGKREDHIVGAQGLGHGNAAPSTVLSMR